MEDVCRLALSKIKIEDQILLMNRKHFLKIRYDPSTYNLIYNIQEINEQHLGDWFDYVVGCLEYMNGILIYSQFGHIHQLFDYVNTTKIIRLNV